MKTLAAWTFTVLFGAIATTTTINNALAVDDCTLCTQQQVGQPDIPFGSRRDLVDSTLVANRRFGVLFLFGEHREFIQ